MLFRSPEVDGQLIRHELSLAREFHELLAKFRPCIERPEKVPTGTMKEPGNGAKNLALGTFSCTGGPDNEDRGMKLAGFFAHDFLF